MADNKDLINSLESAYKKEFEKSLKELFTDEKGKDYKTNLDGFIKRTGSSDRKAEIDHRNKILQLYMEEDKLLSQMRSSQVEHENKIRNLKVQNGLFSQQQEEKLSKKMLNDYKQLYNQLNNNNETLTIEIDKQITEIYAKAIENGKSLTEDEMLQIKQLENEKILIEDTLKTEEEKTLSQLHAKRSEHEKLIYDLKSQHHLFSQQEEEKLSSDTLNNYKQLYEELHDNERLFRAEKDKQMADIYLQALEDNRELTKDEIKQIKQIEKEKLNSEQNVNDKKEENNKKFAESLKNGAKKLVKILFEDIDKLTDIYFFDRIKEGMANLTSAYEQNFTPIAGYSGSDSRQQNHDFIKSVLNEVNANEYTSKGLNFSEEVFPEITEAVKRGFIGEDAKDVAISNAIDKKIMPWLETSSETWVQLQYNLTDERLQQIKGQQLLLQETKEGNRLLQSGVVNQIQDALLPSLDNVVANTTEVEDLSKNMQTTYLYLTEDMGWSKQNAMKYIQQEIEAYQNPYRAITSGSDAVRMKAYDHLFGTDITGALAQSMQGSGWVGAGVLEEELGFISNGETKTENIIITEATIEEGKHKWDSVVGTGLTPKELEKIANNAVKNLSEDITATAEYDNEKENSWAENSFDSNLTAHLADVNQMILDNVIEIKRALIGVIAGLATSLLDKQLNKLTGKIDNNFLKSTGSDVAEEATEEVFEEALESTAKTKGKNILGNLKDLSNTKASGAALIAGGLIEGYHGIMAINEGIDIKNDKTANDIEKQKANADIALGTTATIAGGTAAVSGGLVAAGVSAGPVGWAALAIGGLALGAKALVDHFSALADGSGQIAENFEKSRQAIHEETKTREDQLLSIQEELDLHDDATEAYNYLIEQGLKPNLDVQNATTAELQKYLENLIEVNRELGTDSEFILEDIEASYKNEANKQLDKVKQVLLYEYNSDAIEERLKAAGKDYSDDAVWMEQKTALERAGYSAEKIEALRTHFLDGAADFGEWSDFLYFGFVDGDNIGSFEDHFETGEINPAGINNLMKNVGRKDVQLRDWNNISAQLAPYAQAVAYLNEYKAWGEENSEIKDEAPDTFNQEEYDKHKRLILKANKKLKPDLENIFNSSTVNAPDAMTEWPNELKGFALGSTYIPNDMIAMLHAGERVLTENQNKEYTEQLVSGNSNTIQIGLQDVVTAIKQQTLDIINYFREASLNGSSQLESINMAPSMGNTRVLF